jgi:hypothetical protein
MTTLETRDGGRTREDGMDTVRHTPVGGAVGGRVRAAVPSRTLTIVGVALLTITGVVHFDRADMVHQAAAMLHQPIPYLGILFYLNALGAAVAIAGIAARTRGAWTLGLLVTAPAAVLYVVAGTRGLPQHVHLRTLTTQSGLLCLAAEILYTVLWVSVARADLGL